MSLGVRDRILRFLTWHPYCGSARESSASSAGRDRVVLQNDWLVVPTPRRGQPVLWALRRGERESNSVAMQGKAMDVASREMGDVWSVGFRLACRVSTGYRVMLSTV